MTYKDLTKINLNELEQTITIVKFNEFGYPVVLNLKDIRTNFTDWAQYENCLEIVGKLPRKRKYTRYIIKPNDTFAIFNGTIKEKQFNDYIEKVSEGVISLGTCFSKSNFELFISGNTPLYNSKTLPN